MWEDVAQKKMVPPIRPSYKYSNFDPEYTSLPVRFTFEEDFLKQAPTRRKSDPCLLMQEDKPEDRSMLTAAILYPNFITERLLQPTKIPPVIKLPVVVQEQEYNPSLVEYSRPPSSTFRGYSFMNFRNDSLSSSENQNFSEANHNASKRKIVDNIVVGVDMGGEGIGGVYQYTTSQRSRTISFANQSMLTEGVMDTQKNILYQMDFKLFQANEIQFKAHEYEFNAYNHHFPY